MTSIPETLPIPPAPDGEQPYNSDRHVDQCYVCGRGLTQSGVDNGWFVHMSVRGGIFATADAGLVPERESQGYFPVGSECAKQIPKTHRVKL
jgi:hypothetical protein